MSILKQTKCIVHIPEALFIFSVFSVVNFIHFPKDIDINSFCISASLIKNEQITVNQYITLYTHSLIMNQK